MKKPVKGQILNFDSEELADFDDAKDMRLNNDGYLLANPRVARAGIQLYKGFEVGLPDMETVRVYRPPTEVFYVDAMKSMAHKPVTNDHPSEGVTPKNWKKVVVGMTGGDVARDGDYIRVPMMVCDEAAIKDVQNGKCQLSQGYSASVKWGDGVTEKGEQYDAVQIGMRANHTAIVNRARGGSRLKLGDSRPDDRSKQMRTLTIDGINVQVEDDRDAQLIERRIKTLEDVGKDAVKMLKDNETTIATLQAAVQTKDVELVTVKKQLADAQVTPQKMDEMVKARLAMVDVAKKMIGNALIIDGRSDADIRRQVVTTKLGAAVVAGWSDDNITTSFATLAAIPGNAPNGGGGPTLQDATIAFSRPGYRTEDASSKAYEDSIRDLTDAWKPAHLRAAAAGK